MLHVFPLFFSIFLSIFSLTVGAELLSILDETENGFIWEHIQSYAEQAHGAWLGISVKGWETLTHSLSIALSLQLTLLQKSKILKLIHSEPILPAFIIINRKCN